MKLSIIFITFLFLFTGTISGQNLDDYLILAARNNPDLKARFLQYQSALERVPQVGALPDPQLSFSFLLKPMERFSGEQLGSISIMQMFPWMGTLDAAKLEMAHMAKARYEEFNDAKSSLFFEVKSVWYDLQLLESEMAVTFETIELLKSMERVAVARLSGGSQTGSNQINPVTISSTTSQDQGNSGSGMGNMTMASSIVPSSSSSSSMTGMSSSDGMSGSAGMTDILRVQMEINELQNDMSLLEDKRTVLIARFNELLNRQRQEMVELPDSLETVSLPIDLSVIPDTILSRNPMLQMLSQEESAYEAKAEMNRKMGLPMIGVGLQYELFRRGDNSPGMMNGKDMVMPMVTLSLPVWRKKYNAAVTEAEGMKQSVVYQKQAIENQLLVSYENAHKDFRDAERRAKLYKAQAGLSQQTLNLLLIQYSTEGSNFEEVLRMQQQLLSYRLNQFKSIVDGNLAVAAMERLMGR
ncbi:MAG TPA: TolC family protein [Prolixibacteraceae bacterium]|nr:TolC family protein [Prolixibacteraceae bacterium]